MAPPPFVIQNACVRASPHDAAERLDIPRQRAVARGGAAM
jgi:hypothetical protein